MPGAHRRSDLREAGMRPVAHRDGVQGLGVLGQELGLRGVRVWGLGFRV